MYQFPLSTLQTQERPLLKVNIYLTFFYKLNDTITRVHKFLVSVSTFAIFQTDLTKSTCKKMLKENAIMQGRFRVNRVIE